MLNISINLSAVAFLRDAVIILLGSIFITEKLRPILDSAITHISELRSKRIDAKDIKEDFFDLNINPQFNFSTPPPEVEAQFKNYNGVVEGGGVEIISNQYEKGMEEHYGI